MKFPSQARITYESGSLSNDAWSAAGIISLPKDLSLLNRRGYASTTRKGVPLVYRCKFTLYAQTLAGEGYATVTDFADGDSDGFEPTRNLFTTVKILGAQNNWAMRNAAVVMHDAREKMLKRAGVKKSDRGAYAHEIRYNYDVPDQTWLSCKDGDGDDFVGGTWDSTTLMVESDTDVQLKLVGPASDENSAINDDAQQLGYTYLASRATVLEDTNLHATTTPGRFSFVKQLRDGDMDGHGDNILDNARGEQDNPPYDLFTVADVNNDITEPVELGRLIANQGLPYAECEIHVPFGIFEVQAQHFDAGDTNITSPIAYSLDVLDIYEMQG